MACGTSAEHTRSAHHVSHKVHHCTQGLYWHSRCVRVVIKSQRLGCAHLEKSAKRDCSSCVTWACSTRDLFCDDLKRLALQLVWYLSAWSDTVGHSGTSTHGRVGDQNVTLEEDPLLTLDYHPKGWELRTGVDNCVKVPDIFRYVHHLRAEQGLQCHPV